MTEFPQAPSGAVRAILILTAYAAFLGLLGWLWLPGALALWEDECLAGANHMVCSALQAPKGSGPASQSSAGEGRFAFTSLRMIEAQDLESLQCRDLAIMRNEIFARHGHIFYKPEWRDYFAAQSWYKPAVADALPLLSALEKDNIGRIKQRETALFC